MKRLIRSDYYFFICAFIFIACSGPIRFASKDSSQTISIDRTDSLRIVRALQSDTSLRFSSDLEFSAEELNEVENEPSESINIKLDEFLTKHKLVDTLSSIPTSYERMLMQIINYIGTPYKFGGNSRKGIDCSAFTQTIFAEVFNLEIPRSTLGQIKIGSEIINKEDLKFGDLVFFNTRRRQIPGHVGIYLWDNLFAHASTRNGVVISTMDLGYYDKRYLSGRRVEEIYALTN